MPKRPRAVKLSFLMRFLTGNPVLAVVYSLSMLRKNRNMRRLTQHSSREFDNFRAELKSNRELWGHIDNLLKDTTVYGPNIHTSAEIYVLCRIWQPNIIVETGVASGVSSAIILQALEDNGKGRLYSIDIGKRWFGQEIGWIVPDKLRHRWTLKIGPSQELLAPLLNELKEIDIFYHDSLHTYDNMMFEYKAAWNHIKNNGMLLSHDIDKAFWEFGKQMKRKPLRILYGLGGMLK